MTSENSALYWNRNGENTLQKLLYEKPLERMAKNVIIFIGDGMGVSTITAARIYGGQKDGNSGEESKLSFEKFPYSALVKTYSVDTQVSDSAATATALFTGVKTKNKFLGVTAAAKKADCDSSFGNELTSIFKWAQDKGKSTGLVTTTRVTHATPAALYSHSVHRDWESDFHLPNTTSRCKDIARQLIEDSPGRKTKVVMGGGLQYFLPVTNRQPKGKRKDGRDLVAQWLRGPGTRKFVSTKAELKKLDFGSTDYLLGLFSASHMSFDTKRSFQEDGEPSLTDMTSAAIKVLSKNEDGFFLMVEGGRIDHGHHDGRARFALEETWQFSEAVRMAQEATDPGETLILVTADHSHVFTISGYPKRGNPILGLAGNSDVDHMPYTTLLYSNGPGYNDMEDRANLTEEMTKAKEYRQPAAIPMKSETHGGEDVAVFATGPMAHLVRGVIEQNVIAHIMAYAACLKDHHELCTPDDERNGILTIAATAPTSETRLWLYLLTITLVGLYSRNVLSVV